MSRNKLFWPVFLGVALLLTLGGEFALDDPETLDVEPVSRSETRPAAASDAPADATRPATAAPADPGQLVFPASRRGPVAGELFVGKSFAVPPPPPEEPPPPPPPPPPSAPPLPFAYVGRVVEGARTTVYLSQGERLIEVSQGSVIDNVYRVERIGPRDLTLIYLPLEESQVLAAGDPL